MPRSSGLDSEMEFAAWVEHNMLTKADDARIQNLSLKAEGTSEEAVGKAVHLFETLLVYLSTFSLPTLIIK